MMLPPSITEIKGAAVKLAIQLLIIIAIALMAYAHGKHVAEGEKAQAEYDVAVAYAQEIISQQAIAEQLAEENYRLHAEQLAADKTITKEIIRYAQTPPATRCALSGHWRMLHDAAATGTPTPAQAGSLDDGSTQAIDDAAALQTIANNYSTCRDASAKLISWQNRYRALEDHE